MTNFDYAGAAGAKTQLPGGGAKLGVPQGNGAFVAFMETVRPPALLPFGSAYGVAATPTDPAKTDAESEGDVQPALTDSIEQDAPADPSALGTLAALPPIIAPVPQPDADQSLAGNGDDQALTAAADGQSWQPAVTSETALLTGTARVDFDTDSSHAAQLSPTPIAAADTSPEAASTNAAPQPTKIHEGVAIAQPLVDQNSSAATSLARQEQNTPALHIAATTAQPSAALPTATAPPPLIKDAAQTVLGDSKKSNTTAAAPANNTAVVQSVSTAFVRVTSQSSQTPPPMDQTMGAKPYIAPTLTESQPSQTAPAGAARTVEIQAAFAAEKPLLGDALPALASPTATATPISTPTQTPIIPTMPIPVSALPQHIKTQLSADKPSTIELTLSPEELGKLRLVMTPDGDKLRIVIQAERPETIDLLRRNTESFAADLRQSGFAGTSFSFAGWGDSPQSAPPPRPERSAHALGSTADIATPHKYTPPAQGSGLDLRV